MRLVKLGLLIAALGFIGKGGFEIRKLMLVLSGPPSAPGESKILEHFAVQHVAFPIHCLLLALRPAWLSSVFQSPLVRWFVAALALVLVVPQLLVSFGGPSGGDLFRPYPFDLRIDFLRAVKMVAIGGHNLNLIQLQHLFLNHLLLTLDGFLLVDCNGHIFRSADV